VHGLAAEARHENDELRREHAVPVLGRHLLGHLAVFVLEGRLALPQAQELF
jgi:hypothetical protein